MMLIKKVVKTTVIAILIIFCFSPIIRYISDQIYQRPRDIETVSTNIYDENFEKQWRIIFDTIGKKEDLENSKVSLDIEYESNGDITGFWLKVLTKDDEHFGYSIVSLENWDMYTYTKYKTIHTENYENLLPYTKMLEVLNNIDITELEPNANYSRYSLRFLWYTELSSINENLFILSGKEVVEYKGNSKIEGYLLEKHAINQEGISTNNYYYIFDAK